MTKEKRFIEALTEARDYIARHLESEEGTRRACAELEGLADFVKSESSETVDEQIQKAKGRMKRRLAKTRRLLKKIDDLLK